MDQLKWQYESGAAEATESLATLVGPKRAISRAPRHAEERAEEIVSHVCATVVPDWADACLIDWCERDIVRRSLVTAASVSGVIGENDPRLISETWPIDAPLFGPRQGAFLPSACEDHLTTLPLDERARRELFDMAPRSIMGTALEHHGTVVGSVLLLSTNSGRRFSAADMLRLEQIGARVAADLGPLRRRRVMLAP